MPTRTCRFAVVAAPLFLGSLCGGWGRQAHAQDAAVLSKVTDLNKRALDAYENLDMDEARKFLMNALEACAAEGLNSHPLKARTHVHLGVVLVGGMRRKDLGIAQFKRALEIDKNIKVTKRLNNPEIQAAFDEAVRAMASGALPPAPAVKEDEPAKVAPPEPVAKEPEKPAPPPPPEPKPVETQPAVVGDRPPSKVNGVFHQPVTEGKGSSPIEIKAAVERVLPYEKVVLAYRPEGASAFLARDMERDDKGWYVASIPQAATTGNMVSYYIEARKRNGLAVAANGSPDEPHLITLSAMSEGPAVEPALDHPTVVKKAEPAEEEEEPRPRGAKRFWMAVTVGGGGGFASGAPEVTPTDKMGKALSFSGLAPAPLLNIAPEIGIFLSPNWILSLQGRLQIVTGATDVYAKDCPAFPDDKGVGFCAAAKMAIAGLAKVTYLYGESGNTFRPFLSFSAGGGGIRHAVDLTGLMECGVDQMTQCRDTILGGTVLAGPGAGFAIEMSRALSFIAGVNVLAGFPKTTANVDVNIGLALGL